MKLRYLLTIPLLLVPNIWNIIFLNHCLKQKYLVSWITKATVWKMPDYTTSSVVVKTQKAKEHPVPEGLYWPFTCLFRLGRDGGWGWGARCTVFLSYTGTGSGCSPLKPEWKPVVSPKQMLEVVIWLERLLANCCGWKALLKAVGTEQKRGPALLGMAYVTNGSYLPAQC